MPHAHAQSLSDRKPQGSRADPSVPLQVLLGGIMSILPVALDGTLPALPAIQESFSASAAQVQFSVSAYLFGIAASQMFYGPLSDRFGRRPVLLWTLAAYTLVAAFSAAASLLSFSLTTFVFLRFLQGAAAICGPVLARTIARDLASDERAARLLARITLAFGVATIVGPLIGSALLMLAGWQSIFGMIAACGLILLLACCWWLPETAPDERQGISPSQVAANFSKLLKQRAFLAPTALALASQLGVFVFVTNSALVLVPVLGYAPAQYALLLAVVMLGHIAGVQIANRLVLRHGIVTMLRAGSACSGVGGILLVFLGVFDVRSGVMFVPPMALVMLGNGLIMPNATAAAMSRFSAIAGSASSLQAMSYQVCGAVAAVVVALMFDGTPRPLFLSIALSGIATYLAERALFRNAGTFTN